MQYQKIQKKAGRNGYYGFKRRTRKFGFGKMAIMEKRFFQKAS